MIQLAICSFLVGAVVGLRFKILALLPLTIVGSSAIGAGALLANSSIATLLAGIAIWAVALQAGFLLGSVSRFTVAGARATRLPRDASAKSGNSFTAH